MTKFALAALIALTSTSALAESAFEIPINGGVARVRVNDKCRDALCASVSWQERGGERREFNLPAISSKTISKLLDGKGVKWNATGDDDEDAPAAKPGRAAAKPERAAAKRQSAPKPSGSTGAAPAPAPAPSAGEDDLAGGPIDRLPPARLAPEPDASARSPEPAPSTTRSALSGGSEPKVAAVAPTPAPKSMRPSPIGEWTVEGGEGRVRIEECGANLCGYVSGAKNPNEKDRKNPDPALRGRSVIGAPVLIDMKPSGNRWNGRIYNVKDGKTYTANISLKGADTLRVEGCAFGGMICGGQNWARTN